MESENSSLAAQHVFHLFLNSISVLCSLPFCVKLNWLIISPSLIFFRWFVKIKSLPFFAAPFVKSYVDLVLHLQRKYFWRLYPSAIMNIRWPLSLFRFPVLKSPSTFFSKVLFDQTGLNDQLGHKNISFSYVEWVFYVFSRCPYWYLNLDNRSVCVCTGSCLLSTAVLSEMPINSSLIAPQHKSSSYILKFHHCGK